MTVVPSWKERAAAQDGAFKEALQTISQTELDSFTPTPLAVTTMSVKSVLNAEKLKLGCIVERFSSDAVQALIKYVIKEAYTVTLKPPDADKSFSNCAILKFAGERNTVAVKIFSNGVLHVTGLVSVAEMEDVLDFVCAIMDTIYAKKLGTFQVHDFYVQMMNTNFSVQSRLDKKRVLEALVAKNLDAWIPDEASCHPGVQLRVHVTGRKGDKVKTYVSVFIFASGHVIITGVKSGAELALAYETVARVLNDEFEYVRLDGSTSSLGAKFKSEEKKPEAEMDDAWLAEFDNALDALDTKDVDDPEDAEDFFAEGELGSRRGCPKRGKKRTRACMTPPPCDLPPPTPLLHA
jgi:TATA-box binding protein (TBP) (component of TFIID and TFIIIB)